MRFVGAIWKLLVGIKDALVLVFMLIFFSLLYMGLKSSPNKVGEGVLVMDLNGTVGVDSAPGLGTRITIEIPGGLPKRP
mgnify:CR=1 FL=1